MNATILLLAAATAVRNPFWPIDYEGKMEPITAEVVHHAEKPPENPEPGQAPVQTETKEEDTVPSVKDEKPAMETNQTDDSRIWAAARKELKISGSTAVTAANGTKRYSVVINGRIYGDGDLVSVNCENRRFTWRVKGLSGGSTVKLVRVRVRELKKEEIAKGSKAKGAKKK